MSGRTSETIKGRNHHDGKSALPSIFQQRIKTGPFGFTAGNADILIGSDDLEAPPFGKLTQLQ
jgi:hypothetical protein